MSSPVLELLHRQPGWVSGQVLADALGLTRAAVSKQVQALRADGWQIEVSRASGYKAGFVDLLDAAQIHSGLRRDVQVEVVQRTDSTNDDLMRATPGAHPVARLAEQQAAGRGRRGRQWQSPPGCNLHLSLSWRFDRLAGPMGALGPAVAISVVRALDRWAPTPLQIKWPNDIQDASGRKLAGVLIDAVGEPAGPLRVVVGVGVNVHLQASDAKIDQPWTSLASMDSSATSPPDRNAVAAALIDSLAEDLAKFAGSGFAGFTDAWASRDALAGKPVTTSGGQSGVEGIAAGIAPDGALQIDTGRGVTAVYAADVSVRPA